ncbi:winged helix DNA-binding protein [Altererythrobacter arenosus]|uniref:Winged helix DNA-binding protein n=1 Tax=Altererythrobacter arenosus TaxID=3032592 RepID=A0ABY8FNT5_9SPHN|nr:MarR family transcriptional regulator [Altererythrobacter sp. CAU 1644]WFL76447.1 winged helix DNA-binding protein [Altererythrobacter sp. CAU 1644]
MKAAEFASEMLLHCVGGRTLQIARVVSARFDHELAEHGLTAQQLTLLSMVCVLQPVRPRDMLPFLKMEQSTLSRNLERMAAKGWLTLDPSEDDQRTRLVSLTRAGTEKLSSAQGAWQRAQDGLAADLGPERIDQLKDIAQMFNPLLPSDRLRGLAALEQSDENTEK